MARTYIGGVSFRVGRTASIEELFTASSTSVPDIEFFRARGLRHYCAQVKSLGSMCSAVIRESLRLCSLEPHQVGAVVIDSEQWHCVTEDRVQLLESLHACGLVQVAVIGIELQTCSGCLTALNVADRLVRTDCERRPVLVLVCGRVAPGSSRADLRRATVLSDGVASCVVSTAPLGPFALLASTNHTNLQMVRGGVAGEKAAISLVRSHADISSIASRLYRIGEVIAQEVQALLCTNGNLMYTTFAGRATGIPEERIYTENVAAYGHVFSCDHLINLATYGASKGFVEGGKYLLIGWSPYVFGGALVSYEGAHG